MTVQMENVTERDLRFGVLKIALALAFGLLFIAFGLSFLFSYDAGKLPSVVINALLLAIAVSILANGVLTVLKISDWFEERRKKKVVK